jgi:PPOX class probable F420-dependent enzyme
MHHRPVERQVVLTPEQRRFVADARRAVLATTAPDGRPRLVPICHVLTDGEEPPRLYTPIDEKPKASSDPLALARVRDVVARPQIAVLVDRWDEDWSNLAWVRVYGSAEILEPGAGDEHRAAVVALRSKYPQYREQRLEDRPIIRIAIERVRSWAARW